MPDLIESLPKGSSGPDSTPPRSKDDYRSYYGLSSGWPAAADVGGGVTPCRIEGEIGDVVAFGKIPEAIDGTFYRVMSDPYFIPDPGYVPVDGDGSISAVRFRNGRADLKIRYVETERLQLERQANKAMFGLYRNPWTHHPCVRAAVDSTANTNVILWADKLLALKESGLPYAMDPDTLETLGYDPFEGQIAAKTFTAHPKLDPNIDQLVVYGYEAKGIASLDIVTYALDRAGIKAAGSERWATPPFPGMMHDCAITQNWLILNLWPFDSSIERMKVGGHHWAYRYDLPATFVLVPRNDEVARKKYGWDTDERQRSYPWKNCMNIHVGGAWETERGEICLDTTRVHDNAMPWFPPEDSQMPSRTATSDYVRWTIDPSKPNHSTVADPEVLLDLPCEFPRVDERFYTKPTTWTFLNAFLPEGDTDRAHPFQGLNAIVMLNTTNGETKTFRAGTDSYVQEPVFIPRTPDSDEADGWIMSLVERKALSRTDILIIDTKNFEKPVAVVPLPIQLKAQVHGNWVDHARLNKRQRLVNKNSGRVRVSGKGSLEPL